MRVHILGICGTFMGGVAVLAQRLGHQVTGSDANVYPPMSTQLESEGIALMEGYRAENLDHQPDVVIIGNALSRGNPEVEAILDRGLAYTSGAQWLSEHVLHNRWVLAVAGTHGKTTTSSMLAWILDQAGKSPGFLIGGVPLDFGVSARLGESDYFVIEADEYDTAFFDKRSKFVHYRPKTCVLNNLEFDHADIFPDLDAIKRQFHHLVRTIPGSGLILYPQADAALQSVLEMGCWSHTETLAPDGPNADWQADQIEPGCSRFRVLHQEQVVATLEWSLTGQHNVANALGAIAAAHHVGIDPATAIDALSRFRNVKRRMEVRAEIDGITLYDDFAHHPTAIATTLAGLRGKVGTARIIAILEPRSNTMQLGVHKDTLGPSLAEADTSLVFAPAGLNWSTASLANDHIQVFDQISQIVSYLKQHSQTGDHLVFMSNGGFGGIHQQVEQALRG